MTIETAPPDLAILRQPTELDIVECDGLAVALAWPGTGSLFRGMHRIDLAPGGRTKRLRHPGEAAYTVSSGAMEVEGLSGEARAEAPAVLFVPAATEYAFASTNGATIFGGPCPPDPALYEDAYAGPSGDNGTGAVRIFDPRTEGLPIPMISRQGRLVVWPGIGAEIATMVYVILEPGKANDPHEHESSDDTIAILEGRGSIDNLSDGSTHEFEAGDVVFVRSGVRHKVKADRGSRIVATGGPCPPDYRMLEAISALSSSRNNM
jgi:quercetin dioxygenase-like cupin family protein